MPNLANRLKNDAINVLSKRGISYTIVEEYSDTIAKGRIIRTNPEPGTSVTSTIVLYVSKGQKAVSSVKEEVSSETPVTPPESSEAQTTTSSASSDSGNTGNTENIEQTPTE